MSISPVSFGKIFVVLGTEQEAKEIAGRANREPKYIHVPKGKGRHALNKAIHKIIDDANTAKARTCVIDGEVYIFSGKDSSKFRNSYSQAQNESKGKNHVLNVSPATPVKQRNPKELNAIREKAFENHFDRVRKMIANAAEVQTLRVEHYTEEEIKKWGIAPNKKGDIKSVNLVV